MIADRDPGDEDDRDPDRIVAAAMARSLPVATSRRVLERRMAIDDAAEIDRRMRRLSRPRP